MRIARSAPFTPEDQDVVAHLVLYRRGVCWLAGLLALSYLTDRRDGELMWRLERTRADVDSMMRNTDGTATAHSLLRCGLEPRVLL
jgi:hypothetical protein